jgi:CubicO group peptidase (beta-lactamase class C family)
VDLANHITNGKGIMRRVLVSTIVVLQAAGCHPQPINQALDTACDDKQCVSITEVSNNIAKALDGKVVGYASYVGAPLGVPGHHGMARTAANAPAVDYQTATKMPVASVSKLVTALAAVKVLGKHQIALTSAIGSHLPADWAVPPAVAAITFQELLSHSSGIHNYGNTTQDYADIKKFFSGLSDVSNKTRDYSNYNFSIFRILLPMIEGFTDTGTNTDLAKRPERLAAAYVQIVQASVFDPIGLHDVQCKPAASGGAAKSYAFSYAFPGTSSGWDWGDDTLGCGHAGWYLSVDDVASLLLHIRDGDGLVVSKAQSDTMEKLVLGWDVAVDGSGYRYVEKNGGWGWNGTSLSTTAAIFGPGVIGVLFVNSDISGSPGVGADTVLYNAYKAALKPKPAP